MADLILIACHGPLAAALKGSTELIIGYKYPILAAPYFEGDLDSIDHAVADALEQAGPDGRVFALTDLLGGSVNTRIAACTDPRLTLITGANLGLVVELASSLTLLGPGRLPQIVESARAGLQLVELSGSDEGEDF